jgi:hypothetical protein
MAIVTPERPTEGPQAAHTQPEGLETPSQQYLRTSKRQQRMPDQLPITFQIGGGVDNNKKSVTGAVNQQIQEAQRTTQTRHNIITTLAEAIDKCMEGYTSPTEAGIARELRQRVIEALTTSLHNAPGATNKPATIQRTWADVAGTPKAPIGAPGNGPRPNTRRSTQTEKAPKLHRPVDGRILITVPTATRLKQASPFAIRQAICAAVENLALPDIPKATTTQTGWAITPASRDIRDQLMGQANRELMIKAVEGEDARLPVKWINYAVQGVTSAYRSIAGTEIPTTTELVAQEAYSQTKQHPVSCRPSRHGPNAVGLTTWIISYQQTVQPFCLFGTSEYSKAQANDTVSLLAETRRQLNDYSTQYANNQHLLLTIASPAGPANYNKMKLAAIDKYLDFWNLVSVISS